MKIIGVTGGVGAGKSSVLDYLHKKYNAVVERLDDVSRRLLDKDGACYRETIELFGSEIVRDDGSLDRSCIASIVFSDPSMMEKLNGIVHPAVRCETERIIAENRQEGTDLLVLEAALLIEQHYDEICDELWYIYASVETRTHRLMESRGYTRERIEGTMASQLSEEEFRAKATFVLDNDGDFEASRIQIDKHMEG
ncbi:MAG: dephospho-CoA kinase [Lachnospiraceae bacterium]|nr:dephospho-CoA kinase [Lachnospiraceae bacterium]